MNSAISSQAPSDAELLLLLAGAEPGAMRSWRLASTVHSRVARGLLTTTACLWAYDVARVLLAVRAIR